MKYFNLFAAILLVLIYSSSSIPPSARLNLWIVTFMIPFALVANVILMCIGVIRRKKSTLFLLIAFIAGGNHLSSTIGMRGAWSDRVVTPPKSLTVLNYNVGGFNVGFYHGMNRAAFLKADSLQKEMISWVVNGDADVKCYQEFPHNPEADFDLLTALEERGYEHYFSAENPSANGWSFGIVIASRFPILKFGDVLASANGFNRVAFADVNTGSDTIRIINVHLQSMQMKRFHPGYSDDLQGGERKMKIILRKLKSGTFERARQIAELIEFIDKSPYPVICAGDFNEMPYSYSYRMLRKHLNNTFEKAGRGFGFTYNGNTLSMLRIDNQFYSDPIKPVEFATLNSVTYTDHFPLYGKYALPESLPR